jgi:hypothetical protein
MPHFLPHCLAWLRHVPVAKVVFFVGVVLGNLTPTLRFRKQALQGFTI